VKIRLNGYRIVKIAICTFSQCHANDTSLRENIFEHFEIMERNLRNKKLRETFEGILITLEQPKINKQFEHKSTKLQTNFNLQKSDNM